MKTKKNYGYYVFFIGLFIFFLIVNIKLPSINDDVYFSTVPSEYANSFEFLKYRYYSWTSRLVIEFILINIIKIPILWAFLNTLICAATVYFIYKLFGLKTSSYSSLMILFLFLLFPYYIVGSAGWITTTVNYIWPLFFGIVATYPIKKALYDEKIKWFESPLYLVSLIIAASNEPVLALMLGFYVIFVGYLFYKQKKINLFLIFGLVLIIGCLIFSLTTPGNDNRYREEMRNWFPEFGELSIFEKLSISIFFSSKYFLGGNNVFLAFLVMLCFFNVYFVEKKPALLYMTVSLPVMQIFLRYIPKNVLYADNFEVFKRLSTKWLIILLMIYIFTVVVMNLLNFENKEIAALIIILLLAGYCAMNMIAFSPTVYASVDRTWAYMYYMNIMATYVLYGQISKKIGKSKSYTILICVGVYSLIFFVFDMIRILNI